MLKTIESRIIYSIKMFKAGLQIIFEQFHFFSVRFTIDSDLFLCTHQKQYFAKWISSFLMLCELNSWCKFARYTIKVSVEKFVGAQQFSVFCMVERIDLTWLSQQAFAYGTNHLIQNLYSNSRLYCPTFRLPTLHSSKIRLSTLASMSL